jgi:outer membrane protein with beta-barrel domain
VVAATPGGITAAASFEVLPVGTFKVDIPGVGSDSTGTKAAYGLAGQIDYWVTDALSVGFAPRYILSVNTSASKGDSATELDLRVRVQYNHQVNPMFQLFGFVAPGYSIIIPPDDSQSSKGLAIGFGGGGRYLINDKLFAQGELGYQLGFQKITEGSTRATVATNYLHIGVGIGTQF